MTSPSLDGLVIAPPVSRLDELVGWRAASSPHAPALKLGGRVVSYATLAADVDVLAKALIASGVQRGDRVATLQTPSPDYVSVFLATVSIGAIWVGLNPKYRLQELAHVVSDAAPKLLISRLTVDGRDYGPELAVLGAGDDVPMLVSFEAAHRAEGITSMNRFLSGGADVSDADLATRRESVASDDACLIVYTSGSSGRPKGAVLHQRGIIDFVRAINTVWPVWPHRSLNFLPINHVGCVVDITLPALACGGCVVFMEHFDAQAATAALASERITLWGSVPSVFALQIQSEAYREADLSSLQLIVWEGAAMPEPLLAELLKLDRPMATAYGMTETVSPALATTPTRDLDVLANSVGRAFPNVEVKLDQPLALKDGRSDAPAELLVRSPYMLARYWNDPVATERSFTSDGFFRTGDLAEARPDGRFRIVGRLSEMFKSGGYNVYPREVEAALEEHPAVTLAAVVSRPDEVWQEVGVAYVATETAVTAADLTAWCRARLANYKVPKAIVLQNDLPLLPIGKVDKVALRAQARSGGAISG